jgi:uncharacterized membrane protein
VSEPRLRVAIATLALAGVGITAYLVAARYSGGQILCTSGGCETVQHSRYSQVLGVPVAVLGLAGYVVLAGTSGLRSAAAAAVGAVAATAGLAFAAYLVYVQLALIGETCEWCLGSDALLVGLVPLTLVRLSTYARTV